MTAAGSTTVIPSARRLMSSLRDIGYDTPAAVADLVDNSIDADATRRGYRRSATTGADSWIRIADDGIGMTARELDEAMRYGSARDYGASDLGHFGLGLKTASLSQCRRLTVAARSTARARIEIRRWDLDHVARPTPGRWSGSRRANARAGCSSRSSEHPEPSSCGRDSTASSTTHGPTGRAAMAGLERVVDEIGEHLSMVFHRFLSGELDGAADGFASRSTAASSSAWDPYARDGAGAPRCSPRSG